MAVVILYGSEAGTAEQVAEHMVDVLSDQDVSLYDMMEYDPGDMETSDFHIVVCSTYGDGELPTGAEPFFEALEDDEPDLSGVQFALFGLGDSVYDTFNRGGEIMAGKLTSLGAEQVGEHARHDSSGDVKPKAQAEEWVRTIAAEFLS
ncbi:flavodoxin domain-containing protein [Rhodococcus sp. HNM0569]|uniref:flavodoxin domain-containing protein n=1 Tax=Rhodococcus sp. HNM0569 TaxID=2716340 RepID=UPI00146D3D08|nr:flavodoxin domain-containing protein [Rhodococcus sp. HNM0569]NLU81215.1 nitric oxide synthase [Rhodococcus sp. HNM0569]